MTRPGRPDSRKWERVRRLALDRDGWRCTKCGSAGRLEVHHIIPVHVDPSLQYELSNCATLCISCHVRAHRRPLSAGARAWRAFVEELR